MTLSPVGCRPVMARGRVGAASTAHPTATEAALALLRSGGTAVDAAIAAQAVICTVMPHAAGLGGDLLALVRTSQGTGAVNGVGRSPAAAPPAGWTTDGGGSVTVPGLVDGWLTLHRLHGRLPLADVLAPAWQLAQESRVAASLLQALAPHRARLARYGGDGWPLLGLQPGDPWHQPLLAEVLRGVAAHGRDAFYAGAAAQAMCEAVQRAGGSLQLDDLASHSTAVPDPVQVSWDGGHLLVQPPSSQGVLLAMAAAALEAGTPAAADVLDHLLVELTDAAFAHRADVVECGEALLDEPLPVDPDRASRRGGARSYLHTAGVAVADASGMVVSSLVSVFDDFGSGVLVPELGLVLANRAAGFTSGANAAGPGRLPVHTLAPALTLPASGGALALATPGADGQVQTLLQVLAAVRYAGADLPTALARHRWRSQDARLLVEEGHPAVAELARRGHDVDVRPMGDEIFGAVVAAGTDDEGPFAVADVRRDVRAGATS